VNNVALPDMVYMCHMLFLRVILFNSSVAGCCMRILLLLFYFFMWHFVHC